MKNIRRRIRDSFLWYPSTVSVIQKDLKLFIKEWLHGSRDNANLTV